MQNLQSISSLFRNKFNNFINKQAQMLDTGDDYYQEMISISIYACFQILLIFSLFIMLLYTCN